MDTLLPPDPELELLHTRTYEVRSYRKDDDTMMIRGAVRDVKPAGLMLDDDPEPLTIHHMIVEIDVTLPTMDITRAEVVFEERPHSTCTGIVPHYEKLVGLSSPEGSPTRCVSCSVVRGAVRTSRRCCRPWPRCRFSLASRCLRRAGGLRVQRACPAADR